MDKKVLSVDKIKFLAENIVDVSSSKQYYCLLYWILIELKDKEKKDFEKSITTLLTQLEKIRDENFEEPDYLISEIKETIECDLDSYFLQLFKLKE